MDRWLGRLGEGTRGMAGFHLRTWLGWLGESGSEYAGMTPDELVRAQKDAVGDARFELLDLVQDYVNGRVGTYSYKKGMYAYIRSFFMHNRAELPRDRRFIIRAEKPKTVGDLSPAEIRDMILSCKPVYRATFLCMFQGGMGQDEFTWWNEDGLDSLLDQLRMNGDVITVKMPGRKLNLNRHPYRTYIGSDAIEAVRSWLKIRPHGDGPIFTDQYGNAPSKKAIRTYWLRHLRKLGIVGPKTEGSDKGYRTGKSVHELRDVFRSQWEKSPATKSVSEFMMGHVVDRLEYNKAYRDEAWTLREYRKALPMLQLMSSGRPFGQVEEYEVETLSARVKELEAKVTEMTYSYDYFQRLAKQASELELQQDEAARVAEIEEKN